MRVIKKSRLFIGNPPFFGILVLKTTEKTFGSKKCFISYMRGLELLDREVSVGENND